jgi:hypothetical protein
MDFQWPRRTFDDILEEGAGPYDTTKRSESDELEIEAGPEWGQLTLNDCNYLQTQDYCGATVGYFGRGVIGL